MGEKAKKKYEKKKKAAVKTVEEKNQEARATARTARKQALKVVKIEGKAKAIEQGKSLRNIKKMVKRLKHAKKDEATVEKQAGEANGIAKRAAKKKKKKKKSTRVDTTA